MFQSAFVRNINTVTDQQLVCKRHWAKSIGTKKIDRRQYTYFVDWHFFE